MQIVKVECEKVTEGEWKVRIKNASGEVIFLDTNCTSKKHGLERLEKISLDKDLVPVSIEIKEDGCKISHP